MIVIDNKGNSYKLTYKEFVCKEDIKDSYILWELSLISDYECYVIEHKQYVYYENLEISLFENDYKIQE